MKHRFIMSVAGLAASACLAAPQVEDTFSTYAPGFIHTQAGAPVGFAQTWNDANLAGLISGSILQVTDPVGGYLFSRVLAGAASVFFPTDGSSFYFAMTFSVQNDQPFQFSVSPRHAGATAAWDFGVQNGTYYLGGIGTAGAVPLGTNITLVSRITRNDAGNDSLVMWVNPSAEGDAPLLSGAGNYVDAGRSTYTNVTVTIAEFNTAQAQVDRIAGATSFAEVVASPVPEPSTMSLLLLSSLAVYAARRRR